MPWNQPADPISIPKVTMRKPTEQMAGPEWLFRVPPGPASFKRARRAGAQNCTAQIGLKSQAPASCGSCMLWRRASASTPLQIWPTRHPCLRPTADRCRANRGFGDAD